MDSAIPYCQLYFTCGLVFSPVRTPCLCILILIVVLTRLLYFDPHPLSPLISSRAHSRLDFLFTLWKTVLGILFPILAPSAPLFFGVYLFVGSFVFLLLRLHWLPYYRLYLNQLYCAFAAVHFYANLLSFFFGGGGVNGGTSSSSLGTAWCSCWLLSACFLP